MTAAEKMNDYAGAGDWRWRAIDDAKAQLTAALESLELLRRMTVRSKSIEHVTTIRRRINAALARLGG